VIGLQSDWSPASLLITGNDVYVNIIEKSFVISFATEIVFILSTWVSKEKYIKSKLSKACMRRLKFENFDLNLFGQTIEIESTLIFLTSRYRYCLKMINKKNVYFSIINYEIMKNF